MTIPNPSTRPARNDGTQAQDGPAVTYRVNAVFYAIALLAVVVAGAAALWGPAVVTLVALVAVPVVFLIFVGLSWPYSPND